MTPNHTNFVSDDDRRAYRQWMRNLVLFYGGVFVLAVALATIHVTQRAHEFAEKFPRAEMSRSTSISEAGWRAP